MAVETNLAILIDAENTPAERIGDVLDACAKFGRAIIRRAYGDWRTPDLSGWSGIFKEHPISAIQQFHYVSGKNSSDSAMMIDAMDILREKKVETFALVTSDSDFTKLAVRLREDGVRVVGIGRQTAPKSFVKACDEFLFLEFIASRPETMKEVDKKISKAGEKKLSSIKTEASSDGRELLLKAAQTSADENGIIRGAELGAILRRLDPAFNLKNFGVNKLSAFVALYPDIIVPTGSKAGTDPTYKLAESQTK